MVYKRRKKEGTQKEVEGLPKAQTAYHTMKEILVTWRMKPKNKRVSDIFKFLSHIND